MLNLNGLQSCSIWATQCEYANRYGGLIQYGWTESFRYKCSLNWSRYGTLFISFTLLNATTDEILAAWEYDKNGKSHNGWSVPLPEELMYVYRDLVHYFTENRAKLLGYYVGDPKKTT